MKNAEPRLYILPLVESIWALRCKCNASNMLDAYLREVLALLQNSYSSFGGKYRARTYDPLLVRQMLSQLS